MNRLVFADVNIIRILTDGKIGTIGDVAVIAILAGCNKVDLAVFLCFVICLFGPVAGYDIVSNAVFHKVHGQHCKLKRCTALNEHDLVVIGNVHKVAQILLGFVDDLLENLGPVAHLHDAHAAAFIVEKVVAHALKNLNGEDGGACGEVINTIVFHSKNSFRKNSSLVFGKPGSG